MSLRVRTHPSSQGLHPSSQGLTAARDLHRPDPGRLKALIYKRPGQISAQALGFMHGTGSARKLAVVSKAHTLELGRFSDS
jgi:hypothetical protein